MQSVITPKSLAASTLAVLACASTLAAQTPGTVVTEAKISSLFGNFGGVLNPKDGFGQSVTALGDVNGDGIGDVAVGAWKDDDGGLDHGAIWILFLGTAGEVLSEQKISDTSGGFTGPLTDNDDFGSSCEGLGDLDGDGIPDLAVGAPGDDQLGIGTGAFWVLLLNADGTVKSESHVTDGTGGFTGALDPRDLFGQSLLNAGDLDGDGVIDIVSGAQFDDDGGMNFGAIWICYMNTDGSVKSQKKISSTSGGFGGVLTTTDSFGASLALLDDLDGNGFNEIAVGASRADRDGGFFVGSVWILFLDGNQDVVSELEIGNGLGGFPSILNDQDRFGYGLTSIQDLDGDGLRELVVGAPKNDLVGNNRGVLYILYLNTDGSVRDRQSIGPGQGGFAPLLDDGDEFGRGVCFVPDLDGDGFEELIVGMPFEDNGGSSSSDFGAAWNLFLEDACATATATFRGDAMGVNLTGYLAPPVQIGLDWMPSVDNSGTGNNLVLVVGYATALDLFVPSLGSVLVNISDPGGELLGSPVGAGTGPVTLSVPVPSLVSLCGVSLATQGVSFGGGNGINLHNAYDVVIGN